MGKVQFQLIMILVVRVELTLLLVFFVNFFRTCFSHRFLIVDFLHVLLKFTNVNPVQFFVSLLHPLPVLMIEQQLFFPSENFFLGTLEFFT
jgi:hypothetical protein